MKRIFLLLAFLGCVQGWAQQSGFAELLRYYAADKNFNGTVLVAKEGKIEFLSAAGLSNRQSEIAFNTKAKFRICSVTKTFTAILILQLLEEGKLKLNGTIGEYLPGYTGEGRNKVTIENLLTYSSGIPDCDEVGGEAIYKVPILQDAFIANYCSGNLLWKPGEKFNYNNGDFIILGAIVEALAGKDFTQCLQQRILQPLKMENTGMLHTKDIITGLAPAYVYGDSTKTFENDPPYLIENYFAAGAMYSTAEDLLKFDRGIFGYKLLKKATVDLLLQPHKNLDNVGLGFWAAAGYGLLNTPFVYRPGGIGGATANWIHVLDSNRSIVVLSNTNATDLFSFSQQLNGVATGVKMPLLPAAPGGAPTVFTAENIKGTWRLDLRPTPNSEAYFQDFKITGVTGKTFTGVFYGTAFTGGLLNTDWQGVYFAFTTADKENTYFHSGFIEGNVISGTSFSEGRRFLSHWTGTKK